MREKEILDRVLAWSADDQEKVVQFVREVEQRRSGDDLTNAEWAVVEQRAARKDLASDEEVEKLFNRYRRRKLRYGRGALSDLDEI
jgi:hypothetical protein